MGDVKLNSSGGGSVTLTTPSTASNLTVTLPSASGTLATTSGTGSVFTNPTINGFTGDTSVVNIGSGQFYKDTSGNVGIGTSSPGAKLTVASGAIRLSDGFEIGWGDNSTYIAGSGATDTLQFITSGAEKMRLDSSGNLGLGVTPSYKLDVNGYLRTGGTSPNASGINVFNSQQYVYTTANWNYSNLNLIRPSTNTASPRFLSCMLDGDSDASTTIGGYPAIWGIYSGTPTTGSTSSGLSAKMGLASYAGFNYYINGTQAMTLDASGQLLVGCTANPGSCALVLSKDSGTTRWQVGPSSAGGVTQFYVTATTASQGVYLASTTATSWTGLSDERYKDIIEPITNAVFKINTLRAVIGKFKDDAIEMRRPFLIAQDVQAVLPEAVDASDPDKLGVAYTDTIPLLVAAIKELSAKNSELESRLAALEGK